MELCRSSAHGWAAGCPLARACCMAWVPGKEPSGAKASLNIYLEARFEEQIILQRRTHIHASLLLSDVPYEAVYIDLMSDIVSELSRQWRASPAHETAVRLHLQCCSMPLIRLMKPAKLFHSRPRLSEFWNAQEDDLACLSD